MGLRNIRLKDDEILRKKSKVVDNIDNKIRLLIDDMVETMYANKGIGLAAPQVGILKRIIVIDLADGSGVKHLVNPCIVEQEGEQVSNEGCLSVPGETGFVKRPERLKINAFDRDGNFVEFECNDLLAIAICHEIDHLDGILYTDKVLAGYTEDL